MLNWIKKIFKKKDNTLHYQGITNWMVEMEINNLKGFHEMARHRAKKLREYNKLNK